MDAIMDVPVLKLAKVGKDKTVKKKERKRGLGLGAGSGRAPGFKWISNFSRTLRQTISFTVQRVPGLSSVLNAVAAKLPPFMLSQAFKAAWILIFLSGAGAAYFALNPSANGGSQQGAGKSSASVFAFRAPESSDLDRKDLQSGAGQLNARSLAFVHGVSEPGSAKSAEAAKETGQAAQKEGAQSGAQGGAAAALAAVKAATGGRPSSAQNSASPFGGGLQGRGLGGDSGSGSVNGKLSSFDLGGGPSRAGKPQAPGDLAGAAGPIRSGAFNAGKAAAPKNNAALQSFAGKQLNVANRYGIMSRTGGDTSAAANAQAAFDNNAPAGLDVGGQGAGTGSQLQTNPLGPISSPSNNNMNGANGQCVPYPQCLQTTTTDPCASYGGAEKINCQCEQTGEDPHVCACKAGLASCDAGGGNNTTPWQAQVDQIKLLIEIASAALLAAAVLIYIYYSTDWDLGISEATMTEAIFALGLVALAAGAAIIGLAGYITARYGQGKLGWGYIMMGTIMSLAGIMTMSLDPDADSETLPLLIDAGVAVAGIME